jgi:hypothetical protein
MNQSTFRDIKIAAIINLILMFALGVFFTLPWIAPDFLEVAANAWGLTN